MKQCGYRYIDTLKSEDRFQDPTAASSDGISTSTFPLKPPSHKKCTIFAKMFLNLMYEDWKDIFVIFS